MEKNRFPILHDFIEKTKSPIERELLNVLPSSPQSPLAIGRAMRYSVMSGGKRLRPLLLVLAHRACGGKGNTVFRVACSIELVHTFSLIHDDLPSMDDDDMRRGKPTCHKAFGEGIAVLAGDALLALAFENLASISNSRAISSETAVRLIAELAGATGAHEMMGGQAADLLHEGKKVSLPRVRRIHEQKTGALIRASLRMGGILAGASERMLARLSGYGERIGLAFQITDDILNLQSTPEKLGKAVQNDLERKKPTYPSVIGIGRSCEAVRRLTDEAKKDAKHFGKFRGHFEEMAEFVASRGN
ncbi:MAG: polyprenyl synthetase family protein [Candidatus Eisenbacteria bacterium]|nr:polyprenyl synthetase family protein [Candidatus Eisenbacteria bacterium]